MNSWDEFRTGGLYFASRCGQKWICKLWEIANIKVCKRLHALCKSCFDKQVLTHSLLTLPEEVRPRHVLSPLFFACRSGKKSLSGARGFVQAISLPTTCLYCKNKLWNKKWSLINYNLVIYLSHLLHFFHNSRYTKVLIFDTFTAPLYNSLKVAQF